MKRAMRRMVMAVAAALLVPAAAFAVTVTESFDSYADGALNGKGAAGGGWAGAWGGSDISMLVSNGVAVSDPPQVGTTRSKRLLSESIPFTSGAPTVWISLKYKVDFQTAVGNAWDGMGLWWGAGSTNEGGSFPRCNAAAGNTKWSIWNLDSSPYYTFYTEDITDDTWFDVCVKYEPTGNGLGTYTMWVDPDYGLAEDDPLQAAPILTGSFDYYGYTQLTAITVGANDQQNGIQAYFDDLRISNDSSPFGVIPEPGFALLGLAGLAAATIVRRRRR